MMQTAQLPMPPSNGPVSDLQIERQIDEKLLQAAYERLPLSLCMTTLITGVIFSLVWWVFFDHWCGPDMINPHWFLTGLLLLQLTVVARAIGWWMHRRNQHRWSYRRSKSLFFWLAVLGGAAWNLVSVTVMLTKGTPADMFIVVMIIQSVCGVAGSTMTQQKLAAWGFQASALLPATVAMLFMPSHQPIMLQAGLITMGGLIALFLAGHATHNNFRKLLRLQLQGQQLANDARLAREEADEARQQAEGASLAKSRFLANMSHELRTPLNAVVGAAQLLSAERDNPARIDELTQAIRRGGHNLLTLIENILDLSRIEAGKISLQADNFHLIECLESMLATAAVSAQAKGLKLSCEVEPDLPAWRHGDEGRLRQVLLNLTGNAIKFTDTGEVSVVVTGDADSEHVRITIRDTGVGIPTDQLTHIFEPFHQANSATTRRFGGSGLGLTIVQQVVFALGGTLSVQSKLGQGSSFTVDLPLPLTPPPLKAEQRLRLEVAYLEPHEPSAAALDATLRRLGCTPRRCHDAAEAQAWAAHMESTKEAYLLLDLDATEGALWRHEAVYTPVADRVLGMTHYPTPNESFTENAPQNRLLKPLTRAALVSHLSKHKPSQRQHDAQEQANPDTTNASKPRILVVEDDPLNLAIVSKMLQHAGFATLSACDGLSALRAIEQHLPDLVLLDWQMPDLDGLEVARRVRAGHAGSAATGLPLVALTANAFAEDRQACLDAGMDDFLTKPIDATRLIKVIRHQLVRAQAPREVYDDIGAMP